MPALTLMTLVLAGVTGWMAWATWMLTRIEKIPYITPLDVGLELVDNTKTPVKHITYLTGADPINAVDNIIGYILTVKFANSGRLPGEIKLLKIDSSFGEFHEWDNFTFLVPAQKESGWLFGLGFSSAQLSTSTSIYFDYVLQNSSKEMNFSQKIQFTAECTFPNTSCFILPYKARIPRGLSDN